MHWVSTPRYTVHERSFVFQVSFFFWCAIQQKDERIKFFSLLPKMQERWLTLWNKQIFLKNKANVIFSTLDPLFSSVLIFLFHSFFCKVGKHARLRFIYTNLFFILLDPYL